LGGSFGAAGEEGQLEKEGEELLGGLSTTLDVPLEFVPPAGEGGLGGRDCAHGWFSLRDCRHEVKALLRSPVQVASM
jgi:hypothetical protein